MVQMLIKNTKVANQRKCLCLFQSIVKMILSESLVLDIEVGHDQHIKYLAPALNNTFLMIKTIPFALREERFFVHLDSKKHILWNQRIKSTVKNFGMLTDKQFFYRDVIQEAIVFISLQNYSRYRLNFPRSKLSYQLTGIETFDLTQLFCVHQLQSRPKSLKITYFIYDKIHKQHKQLHSWERVDDEACHIVKKVNNHSKIGWLVVKQDVLNVYLYHLKDGLTQGTFSRISTKQTLVNLYGLRKIIIKVDSIWQIQTNKYLIHSDPYGFDHKKIENLFFSFTIEGSEEEISTSCIQKVVPFWRNKIEGKFCFVKTFGLADFSVVIMRQVENIFKVSFFFQNTNRNILGSEISMIKNSSLNYFIAGWDPQKIVWLEREENLPGQVNPKNEKVQIGMKKFFSAKELSLQILLAMNQDFDDDLLQDSMSLLQ